MMKLPKKIVLLLILSLSLQTSLAFATNKKVPTLIEALFVADLNALNTNAGCKIYWHHKLQSIRLQNSILQRSWSWIVGPLLTVALAPYLPPNKYYRIAIVYAAYYGYGFGFDSLVLLTDQVQMALGHRGTTRIIEDNFKAAAMIDSLEEAVNQKCDALFTIAESDQSSA